MPIWEMEEKKPLVTVPKQNLAQLNKVPSVPSVNLAQANRLVSTPSVNLAQANKVPSVPSVNLAQTNKVPSVPSTNLAQANKVTSPVVSVPSSSSGSSKTKSKSSKPKTPAPTSPAPTASAPTVAPAVTTASAPTVAPAVTTQQEPGIPVGNIDPNYQLLQAKQVYAQAQAAGDVAGMQRAAELGQQARAAGATLDPGNTMGYEQAAAAYNQMVRGMTNEGGQGDIITGFRQNFAALQDITNKAISTSGGAEVAVYYLRYYENALAQAQTAITTAFQQQLGGMDAATQAALTQIRQEFDQLKRSWLEDFARRGLLQSGIAQQSFEERIAARQLTAEQQVIADQFRNVANQINQALMQFAQMRLQGLQQFGLAGIQAAESAANRQQQAFGQALSGALQLAQQQQQQQQFSQQFGLQQQQFGLQQRQFDWQTKTQWPAQLALQQQQAGTSAAAQSLEAQKFGWQQTYQSTQQIQAQWNQAMQYARQMVEIEMPRDAAGRLLNPMTPEQIQQRIDYYAEQYMNGVVGPSVLEQARRRGII